MRIRIFAKRIELIENILLLYFVIGRSEMHVRI